LRQLHTELERQISDLVSSDDWRRMLDTASRFHKYSFGNVCLIMAQRPDATKVAGFNTWKTLGRHVRKGERGIRILAPARYKVTDGDSGEDRWVVRGFTTVAVFDVSQTEGEPLADVRPALVDGEAPAGLWDALAKMVADAGFMLERCDSAEAISGANGVTHYGTHTVTVRRDVSEAQACKTLAHELGHVLLDHESAVRGGPIVGCRGVLEVEAESVAYMVAAACAMATDGYSIPYVALWANGSTDAVKATAGRVLEAAGRIIEKLDDVTGRQLI
jgi:hypothetical protein